MQKLSMLFLADTLLVIHALFVLFVVLSVPLILLGGMRGWGWVRNDWFRHLHLAAIGYVALNTLAGEWCPLTLWESALRQQAGEAGYQSGFIQDMVGQLLYHDLPGWVFTSAYTGFGLLVLALYFAVPPQWMKRRHERRVQSSES